MKRGIFLVLGVFLVLSLSFTSAGLFDFLKKKEIVTITGNTITGNILSSFCQNSICEAEQGDIIEFSVNGVYYQIEPIVINSGYVYIYDYLNNLDLEFEGAGDSISYEAQGQVLKIEILEADDYVVFSYSLLEPSSFSTCDSCLSSGEDYVWCQNATNSDFWFCVERLNSEEAGCNDEEVIAPNYIQNCPLVEETCYDSDGGKNYYVKGITKAGSTIIEDGCVDTFYEEGLRETFCEGNRAVFDDYNCGKEGKVCVDGACVFESMNTTICCLDYNNVSCLACKEGLTVEEYCLEKVSSTECVSSVAVNATLNKESYCSDEGRCLLYEGDKIWYKDHLFTILFMSSTSVTLTYDLVKLNSLGELEAISVEGGTIKIEDIFYTKRIGEKSFVKFHFEEEKISSCKDLVGEKYAECYCGYAIPEGVSDLTCKDVYSCYGLSCDVEGCQNKLGCIIDSWNSYCQNNECKLYEGEEIHFENYAVFINYLSSDSVSLTVQGQEGYEADTGILREGNTPRFNNELNLEIESISYSSKDDSLISYVLFSYFLDEKEQEVECDDGCVRDDKCIPYGFRLKENSQKWYCDLDNEFKLQKTKTSDGSWEECNDNYECESNLCIEGECQAVKDIVSDLKGFRSIGVRLGCKLANLFNGDNYATCVAERIDFNPN
jgi:hypothetical protein